MKILTKILNVIVFMLVCIGIFSIFYYFMVIRQNNEDYENVLDKNKKLTEQIVSNENSLKVLKDSLIIKDAEISWSNEKISEQDNYIKSLEVQLQEDLDNLSNMSLEEVLEYILNYYGTDKATLITHNNELKVVIQEPLVREWSNTITKLESRNIELSGYKDQILTYEELMCQYIDKVDMLERSDSLLNNSLDLEQEKNTGLQQIIDNRNKMIKSLKVQRGILGGVVVVVIVVALL